MSEKQEQHLKLIEGEKEEISDADFELFLKTLFGRYNGGGYLQE